MMLTALLIFSAAWFGLMSIDMVLLMTVATKYRFNLTIWPKFIPGSVLVAVLRGKTEG
jgi:hypothetical protein